MRCLAVLAALPAMALALTPTEVLPAPAMRPGDTPWSVPVAPLDPVAPWMVSISTLGGLSDPFVGKVALLAAVRRSFGPWGGELFGGRAFTWNAPALDVCTAPGICRAPTDVELRAVTGRVDWMGGAWAVRRGGRGRLSPSGLATWPLVFEAGLGAAAVRYAWTGGGRERHATAPAVRWGLAAGFDVATALELRLELGGLVYGASVRDVDTLERQLWLGAVFACHPGGR